MSAYVIAVVAAALASGFSVGWLAARRRYRNAFTVADVNHAACTITLAESPRNFAPGMRVVMSTAPTSGEIARTVRGRR